MHDKASKLLGAYGSYAPSRMTDKVEGMLGKHANYVSSPITGLTSRERQPCFS